MYFLSLTTPNTPLEVSRGLAIVSPVSALRMLVSQVLFARYHSTVECVLSDFHFESAGRLDQPSKPS